MRLRKKCCNDEMIAGLDETQCGVSVSGSLPIPNPPGIYGRENTVGKIGKEKRKGDWEEPDIYSK